MKATAITSNCRAGARQARLRPARQAHTPARRVGGRLCAPPQHGAQAPTAYVEDSGEPVRQDRPVQSGVVGPRVLHVDADPVAAEVLAGLLSPEVHVINAPTLAEARRLLKTDVFSLLVVDPALPDGDVKSLLPMLSGTPVLIYSAHQPEWRGVQAEFLPKPWTTARQLWVAIATRLGISTGFCAGA